MSAPRRARLSRPPTGRRTPGSCHSPPQRTPRSRSRCWSSRATPRATRSPADAWPDPLPVRSWKLCWANDVCESPETTVWETDTMTESGDETIRLGDRYELGGLLGRGGMADVRVGRDLRLGRTVAVKQLRGDLAADDTFQARFRRESQSSAALNHPSIVAVYDTG